ncbi:MAG: hypothetical protein ACI33N_07805 [Desulfovibrionaceae bacterium]
MCIIALKRKGIALPDRNTLETCFYHNPDGAGVAIWRHGEQKVCIHKGFMDFQPFFSFVEKEVCLADTAVLHFRIGTSGGNTPQNCHPFPIEREVHALKALEVTSRFAFIHNGVLGMGEKTLSDTQVFIRDTLYGMRERLAEKGIQKKLEKLTKGSRTIAIDAKKGVMLMTGEWITDKNTGILFSNNSFKPSLWDNMGKGWDDFSDETWIGDSFTCPNCGSGNTAEISSRHALHECALCGTLFDEYDVVWAYGED